MRSHPRHNLPRVVSSAHRYDVDTIKKETIMEIDKLIQKYHRVKEAESVINGLMVAQAICARRMLECNSISEVEIVNRIMEDIVKMMDQAYQVSSQDK